MSKNMTRKGLAFGAGFALVASGFAALPANADGLTGFADFTPETGPETAWAVDKGVGHEFDIQAVFAANTLASGASVKLDVNDTDGVIFPKSGAPLTYAAEAGSAFIANWVRTDGTVTITYDAGDHGIEAGELIQVTTAIAVTDGGGETVAVGYYTVTAVDGANVSFVDGVADNVVDGDTTDNTSEAENFAGVIIASGIIRSADNSFVVPGAANEADEVFTLLTQKDVATDAEVFAWTDNFSNDEVGANTEYVTSTETVTFADLTDVEAVTTLVAPKVGDELLTARITTSPVLNEEQMTANADIRGLFARQGSSSSLLTSANATQDDDTAVWTSTIDLQLGASRGYIVASDGKHGNTADEWADLLKPDETVAGDGGTTGGSVTDNHIEALSINATSKQVTVTTEAAHQLKDGDKITMTATTTGLESAADANRPVTVTSATTFTYVLDTTGTVTAGEVAADAASTLSYTVVTYNDSAQAYSLADRVFPGDYSAVAYITPDGGDNGSADVWTAVSTKSERGTLAAVADDIIFTTTGTEDVQGVTVNTNNAATDLFVAAGTTSLVVTATVVDEDGDAVGAGRAVDYTVTRGGDTTIKVNDRSTGTTLTTDSNGQVTFTVTDTTGADGKTVSISATAEGVSGSVSKIDIEWDKKAISMIDLATTGSEIADSETRYLAEGQSYTLDLLVADQFFTAADSDEYRVKVAGSGVTQGFESLTDGRASVNVSDAGVASSFDVVLTLQKAGTDGEFADTTTVKTITHNTTDNGKLLLGAEGSTLYGSAVDLSDEVAEKALVEADNRAEAVAIPAYANKVTVNGKAMDASTSVARAGAVVTISGPSNILFENGTLRVSKRGSLTVLADSNGLFEFDLYSTTAQEDTEITVSSLGVEETVDVTFTGKGIGEATELTLTAPSNVQPSSTFQVTGSLKDDFGNGVPSAAIEVTYLGPGITFGDLPTATDANGNFRFSVLLGANDTDDISVTVSYDQNADGDYADAKDLTEATTIAIGGSSDQKVNAGSFKGYVAVYALGYERQRLSAKIGNDWVIVDPIVNNESDNLFRVTDFTGAGVDIAVRIYIDRVLIDTINLTTK